MVVVVCGSVFRVVISCCARCREVFFYVSAELRVTVRYHRDAQRAGHICDCIEVRRPLPLMAMVVWWRPSAAVNAHRSTAALPKFLTQCECLRRIVHETNLAQLCGVEGVGGVEWVWKDADVMRRDGRQHTQGG